MGIVEQRLQRRIFAAFDWEWELRLLRDADGEPVQAGITPVLDEHGGFPARVLGNYCDMEHLAMDFNRLAAARGGWVAGAIFAGILQNFAATMRPGCLPGVRALAQVCAPPVLPDGGRSASSGAEKSDMVPRTPALAPGRGHSE